MSMRRLRYGVAMSLDGYIARPKGEFDWIPHDPDIDFAEILPSLASRASLTLEHHRVYEKSGIVSLEYAVKLPERRAAYA